MSIVTVRNLTKRYPGFCLDSVSFSLEEGRITGFIGRNGAGKTTTLKCMLNLVHPDGGEVLFDNRPIERHEMEIKKNIGYSVGKLNWYPRKTLREIAEVTRRFYDEWDIQAYERYRRLFQLDEGKTPLEMSEGMKVKCNLLLALSHRTKVLILDEPTSGLDPFSRDELLELFFEIKNQGVAILFSTHILSDLEKCADDILYISNGRAADKMSRAGFIQTHARGKETLEQILVRWERGARNA